MWIEITDIPKVLRKLSSKDKITMVYQVLQHLQFIGSDAEHLPPYYKHLSAKELALEMRKMGSLLFEMYRKEYEGKEDFYERLKDTDVLFELALKDRERRIRKQG